VLADVGFDKSGIESSSHQHGGLDFMVHFFHTDSMRRKLALIILVACSISLWSADAAKLQVFRTGSDTDVVTKTKAGFALMGGGKDLDEAFTFLCDKSGGGDFVVLRASGTDAYNPYIAGLCKQNSVTTLLIPSRAAANDPAAATAIRRAEAIFIAGGDQSNYINFWQGTPVQTALNDAIRRGVPIGGTSAGLAVLGEFNFAALHDSALSTETLADPFNERVTIMRGFVDIPLLKRTITDTHFFTRDRQGRLLGFLARIVRDGMAPEVRGIGVDERAAVLLDADGTARIIGTGKAAFFYSGGRPEVCEKDKPLTYRNIAVVRIAPGGTFDVAHWRSAGGDHYTLNVVSGKVESTLPGGALY
jgi:cyanophycinase